LISLVGLREVVRTTLALATPYLDDGASETRALRAGLNRYLDTVQPGLPRRAADQPAFIVDPQCSADLARIFDLEIGAVIAEPPDWVVELVHAGRALVAERSPDASGLFELTIDSVFSAGAPAACGSATAAAAVGFVWVGPTRRWEPADAAEALVHELAHTLLALDEHRFGHYPDYERVMDPRHYVRSAIRSEPRPISSALHSVVVACELLHFRAQARLGGREPRLHPPSSVLTVQALQAADSCLEAIQTNPELLSPRATGLVKEARAALRQQRPVVEVA